MAGFYAELEKNYRYPKGYTQTSSETNPNSMPENALALLKYLGKKSFSKKTDMANAPGLSGSSDVDNAFNWLKENDYLTSESYKVAKRGRKAVFGVLTQKAYSQLGITPSDGKGGFEHKLWQHLVSQQLQNDGFKTKIEGRVQKDSPKSIDVLAFSESQGFIGYELTIHFENLASNIRKDIETGVSRVVIVTRDSATMKKAQKIVAADRSLSSYQEKIGFSTMLEFYS